MTLTARQPHGAADWQELADLFAEPSESLERSFSEAIRAIASSGDAGYLSDEESSLLARSIIGLMMSSKVDSLVEHWAYKMPMHHGQPHRWQCNVRAFHSRRGLEHVQST